MKVHLEKHFKPLQLKSLGFSTCASISNGIGLINGWAGGNRNKKPKRKISWAEGVDAIKLDKEIASSMKRSMNLIEHG